MKSVRVLLLIVVYHLVSKTLTLFIALLWSATCVPYPSKKGTLMVHGTIKETKNCVLRDMTTGNTEENTDQDYDPRILSMYGLLGSSTATHLQSSYLVSHSE